MDFELARRNMVEQQIRPWQVNDASVLEALSTVRREQFVPLAQRSLAFADFAIALPAGQCMLEPRLEARMLQDAALQGDETVLEIGAGSGFMAALLARRAQHVVSLEIVPELATLARNNLRVAGVTNVDVRQADGAQPQAAEGQYDVIVLSGSVAEVPGDLLNLLKTGGRLVAVVGDEPIMRGTVVRRTGDKTFETRQDWDANAPRLHNFAAGNRFRF